MRIKSQGRSLLICPRPFLALLSAWLNLALMTELCHHVRVINRVLIAAQIHKFHFWTHYPKPPQQHVINYIFLIRHAVLGGFRWSHLQEYLAHFHICIQIIPSPLLLHIAGTQACTHTCTHTQNLLKSSCTTSKRQISFLHWCARWARYWLRRDIRVYGTSSHLQ